MKTANTIKLGRQLIACLFLLVVIINFENALVFQVNATNISWKIFLWGIVTLFFLLNVATALGLFFAKRWGFWLAYLAIPLTTTFFSNAYIPFISNLLPQNFRYLSMIIGNFLLFAVIVYLHFASLRNQDDNNPGIN